MNPVSAQPACPCCSCRHGRGKEGCGACWTRDDVQAWIDSWGRWDSTKGLRPILEVFHNRRGFACPPKEWAPPCPGWEAKGRRPRLGELRVIEGGTP